MRLGVRWLGKAFLSDWRAETGGECKPRGNPGGEPAESPECGGRVPERGGGDEITGDHDAGGLLPGEGKQWEGVTDSDMQGLRW